MRARGGAWALLAVSLLVVGCDGGSESAPGVLTATLVSPSGPEGAAHVRLIGEGLGAVQGMGALAFSEARGDTLEVVLVREAPGELAFTVAVADTTRRPVALVVEVADGDNRLRGALSTYRLEVRP